MTTTTDPLVRDPATAARGRWLMLIVLLAGQFMALLDVTVVNVAMPTVGRSLHASGAVLSSGFVAGQVIGGVLVTANLFGEAWRPVFLVNVPIGLAVLALVPRAVPRDVPGRGSSGRRLDLAGLAVAVPAVFLVVLPLMLGHQENWPSWVFACVALGLVLSAVFVGVERRIANRGGDPLLNLAVLRAPGLVPGLAAVAVLMITYGGFLFSFALHLQAGLGDSALRAGLTFAPCALVFGACGYFWRRLPAAWHHLLAPLGCLVAVGGYLAVASVLRSGGSGGVLLQVGLIVTGAALALGFSPLVTHALVRVPLRHAADASGLLTTTIQLGQAIGVATFGSLFLTLADGRGGEVPAVSGHALAVTMSWLAAAMLLGVVSGIPLARTVAAARTADGGR